MSLGKRLLTTGGAGVCLTENVNAFTGESADGGVALYSMDYGASDSSGSYDATPVDVDFGVSGKTLFGARFNGSTSYIDLPVNSALTKANDFSWSLWFNLRSTTLNDNQTLFANNSTSTPRYFVMFNNSTLGSIRFFGNGGNNHYSAAGLVTAGTWFHLAVSKSSTEGLIVYLNGVAVITETGETGDYTNGTQANSKNVLGGYYVLNALQTSFALKGKIDQVRIFSKALSSSEVSTLYNSGNGETACVHTATTTDIDFPTTNLAYYKLDNSAEDSHGNTYDGTEGDIEYRFGVYGQAAKFNGSSSFINTNFTVPSSSTFSISWWMNASPSGGGSDNDYIMGDSSSGGTGDTFNIYLNGSSIGFFGTGYTSGGGVVSNCTGDYMHFVMVLDGTTLRFYKNGSQAYTMSITARSAAGTNTLVLGRYGHYSAGTQFNLTGKIDQVRMFGDALTASQVTELFSEKGETDTSNFKAVLYEGNAGHNYISNVGFQPDLVWVKDRNQGVRHLLTDSVRGTASQIFSNEILAAQNYLEFTSFDANGFTVDFNSGSQYFNNTNYDYVAWVWKGGGDAVNIGVNSITASTPSIASDVSANTAAGFSIVKYTGNNTAGATVGHGLLSKPDMIIVKNLDDTPSWEVFHVDVSVTDTSILRLNKSEGLTSVSTAGFDFSAIDSSTFTLGTSGRTNSSHNFIAYCFHSVSGYSSIGTYTGNGNATGTIVSLDFAPSFVMIKGTDQTSDWIMIDNKRDTTNPNAARLDANSNGQEYTGENIMDLNSNGFQLKTSSSSKNGLNKVFIYMAFK